MNLFKKIKDKLFNKKEELHISEENDLYMYIELGTLKDDPYNRKVFAVNNIDINTLEPDTVIFHNGEYYYYDGEKISDLKLKKNRLYNATEFHYYNKQSLTKSFLKSLSPGQLFSLTEPSYCIYMCVKRNNNLQYILVEGEGEEEIFIDDIVEE